MNEINTYTLEELAEAFDLTPRTTRHYIENVLPPHHKTGRGKLARYSQDTFNCFAFIKRARQQSGFTTAQISDVLASLSQEQIDRVAEGLEEMKIVTSLSPDLVENMFLESRDFSVDKSVMASVAPKEAEELSAGAPPRSFRQRLSKYSAMKASPAPSWKKLYDDDELKIMYKGEASEEKREQVTLAAKLVKKILEGSE